MPSTEEQSIWPARLSYRVLQADPEAVSPDLAARAVERYLLRKRPALAQALEVTCRGPLVVLQATGEAPAAMLREAIELIGVGAALVVEGEVEVDAEEFAIAAAEPAEEVLPEREVLHSKVRCFPHPVCEWFEITAGDLMLTDRRILYEPEYVIISEGGPGQLRAGSHNTPLGEVLSFERGEWWDIPCLMLATPALTYRYGWAAERGEPSTVFEVDEWLVALRSLLEG